jgi:hypothetical protein
MYDIACEILSHEELKVKINSVILYDYSLDLFLDSDDNTVYKILENHITSLINVFPILTHSFILFKPEDLKLELTPRKNIQGVFQKLKNKEYEITRPKTPPRPQSPPRQQYRACNRRNDSSDDDFGDYESYGYGYDNNGSYH